VCMWLEGGGPMVEGFEMLPKPAAGRDIHRGTTLVMTVQFTGGFFWLLSQLVLV
jgi:hypothetical protein